MDDHPRESEQGPADETRALAALVDEAPVGLALLDADLRYLRCNAALGRITGAPPRAHIGRALGEFAAPALREELVLAARLALARGKPVSGVELEGRTLRRPDVERRWILDFRPVPSGNGGPPLLSMSALEVTLERRASGQQALTAALAQAVSIDDVARAALAQTLPLAGGAHGAVSVLDADGRTLRVVQRQTAPDTIEKSWTRYSLDDPLPVSDALHTETPVLVESRAELLARYPALIGRDLADGESVAYLPLVSGGRGLGVMTIGFRNPRTFGGEFVALLRSAAGQTAVAIERAQLYERERRTAAVLQQALLPPTLPPIPGLDVAARFRPGAAGVEIGGDFYDAFPIDGRSWGLVIGDITGKGVDAAALTSLTRFTLRAAAHLKSAPSTVLDALNVAVREGSRDELCTAAFGRLTLRDDRVELVLACGGHPAPILVRDGSAAAVGCTGPLIGLADGLHFDECRLRLEPGDAVVLYTDGLTDAGTPAQMLDEEELAELVARFAAEGADASQLAERLIAHALELSAAPRDDIAILVLKVPERVRGRGRAERLVADAV